ncbi:ketopantoate reductase [Caldalkalibacillus uzonensis]|uniref:Ketopantoate reductase n=1 Tax=Caldalkalibacillus uzonensis TaxID=353224 RepID=A0ABU0CWE0_9BACI|nr:ketopantoate reductase [Caldalkalibacillus uzonensis]
MKIGIVGAGAVGALLGEMRQAAIVRKLQKYRLKKPRE